MELMAEEDDDLGLQVMAIRECDEDPDEMEEIFYECQSGDESAPTRTSSMENTGSDALRAQSEDVTGQIQNVCMVREQTPNVVMTLDSGADVSVAPEQYYALGLPGQQRSVCMMDAQGGAIKSAGNRRLRLQAYTRAGEMVEFVEQFALGVGVTHPLMSFGRLLKQGWVLSRDSQGLYVEHKEKGLMIPARLERNSLVMDVRVCAVRAEDNEMQEMEAMVSNDRDSRENALKLAAETHFVDRGVKRSVEEKEEDKKNEEEDQQMLALMQELSQQVEPDASADRVEEAPAKKLKGEEVEDSQRSPGYTTEESGDVIVEASSSEDGRVQARMARWQNWKLRTGMVKEEPMELSDSPVAEVTDDNRVFPVRREAASLYGFISRELALLERMPGWHALPNGIVVHSSPQATHFLDPSLSFGPEWCGRMTLLKKKDNSGAWEQAMRGEPARNFPPGPHEVETSPKRQRMEEVVGNLAPVTPPLGTKREYALPWDDEDDEKRRMSPKRRIQSVQEEFPGGDEMVAEEVLQQQLNDASDDEDVEMSKGKPPEVNEEELMKLDAEACKHEEERLEKMGVLEKLKEGEVDSSAARSLAGRVGVGRTRHIAAGLLWLQQKVGSKELRITGIPTAVNTSDIGTKVLSKARSGLKYLIKMINGDDEKIGYAEYQEIKMKEDLKKNTGKLAKTLGANARVAVVIALSLLQGGQGADTQELETEENEGTDTWWVRLLITMICLASVGALSLARMTLQAVQTWCSRRRGHRQPVQRREEEEDADDPHVRRGVQESTDQQEEPRYENDPEKVNMQWQIVHLEVAVAEQEERLKEAREERDRQAREVVRMYNMCSELRFELEAVKEEKDKAQKKAIQVAGTDDERAQEMERMAEDVARAWEMVELWKKRVTECQRQGQDELRTRALQEVLLHEAARTLDVLGREVAEASLGPVLATLGFERNEEDGPVLGALKAMQNALQEELVAGEAEELIRSPFRRFVQSLLRRMGTRLNARQGLFESADVARVLWEARPFAMALQMRLMAMLLQRFERRLGDNEKLCVYIYIIS
eukprot:g13262.t1